MRGYSQKPLDSRYYIGDTEFDINANNGKKMEIALHELVEFLAGAKTKPTTVKDIAPKITGATIGDYVIVRSRNEGINAGALVEYGIGFVVLDDARRIWYHRPKDKSLSWYEGVAESGLSEDSKISGEVSRKVIVEDYSITTCSKKAEEDIRGQETNEQ